MHMYYLYSSSLFALAPIQAQHASLKRAYAHGEQQRQQLRAQMQVLSGMRGSRADTAKLRRQEQALAQTKGELLQAGARIIALERAERERCGARERDTSMSG